MKSRLISVFSWAVSLWACKVFLSSLPYKFSGHPDTQHIFSTIGTWMSATLSESLGDWFSQYGAYAVGSAELIVSIILLSPIVFFILKKLDIIDNVSERSLIHSVGGMLAASVMAGAVFFHLVTPLGVEVLHNGQSDHGSLFYAALSILVLGSMMAIVNFIHWRGINTASKNTL
ncbi:hypothetical protein [Neptunomonas antarctica]|uniref:Uncharacterized protein n=1 Tax=Neptunomonas antarctica TaxID=619304 RepID=A0A1N7NH75_9GAMM|nr:hypothetical protein [Neptunomonas antarctica]SIS97694.1 hypothetical protein SAMN05421760_109133 [Neptunomonas antarctica]